MIGAFDSARVTSVVKVFGPRLSHRHSCLVVLQLERTLLRESNFVLFLHLVDSRLLLLHYFGQLQLVLKLGARASLRGVFTRVLHLKHFLLPRCRIHIHWRTGLVMHIMVSHVVMLWTSYVCLPNLIGDTQVCLLVGLLPLVHFDGGGPWTCCLVHNLYFTFADLYCGCVLLPLCVGPRAHFFIRGYWW